MKKAIKKMIWISLIITLMSTYIVILSQTIAIAANMVLRDNATNVNNVKFDIYFNSTGANVQEEQILMLNVIVENRGLLRDGVISIEDPNFNIIKDKVQNEYVKEINGNEIKLNSIVYSNSTQIEIPVTFKKQEEFSEDYLEKEIKIKLEGVYEDEVVERISTERTLKASWTADPEISLTQDIGKYIDLGENKILVQENIYTEVKDNILPRRNEVINVKTPVVEDEYPTEVKVIANGIKLSESAVKYDNESGELEITNVKGLNSNGKVNWDNAINEYNIVYTYKYIPEKEISVKNRLFNLDAKVSMSLYGKVDPIEKEEQKEISTLPKGTIVDIQKQATSELYKGYMYANSPNETTFDEINTVKISKADTSGIIEITNNNTSFIDETNKVYDISENVLYKSTVVNKKQLERIFGKEYSIDIVDYQNNKIAVITNATQSDSVGNVTINYENEVKYIKILTTKPLTEGNFDIKNTRVIRGNANYSKEQLKTFNKIALETTAKEMESNATSQALIELKDTKTEAIIEMNNTNLSTLQTNKDVQFLMTLMSNTAEYDLYKNPTVEIILPQELNINVKTTQQLNFEDELKITKVEMGERPDGRKVIRLGFSGEQVNFANDLTRGIQVAIIADITISNTLPSKDETIRFVYSNENANNQQYEYDVPIKIKSKDGVLMINKVGNYSESGDILETSDDKFVSAKLDKKSEEKLATELITIVNNYDQPISNVSLIGKIGEQEEVDGKLLKTTIESKLQDIMAQQNKEVSIYYTDKNDLDRESGEWKTTTDGLEKVRAFKIVINGNILPQEVYSIGYNIDLPENIGDGESIYTKTTLEYNYIQNSEEMMSIVELKTDGTKVENQSSSTPDITSTEEPSTQSSQEVGEEYTQQESEKTGLAINIEATTGDKTLSENDTVIEGQGIKYKIKVKNNTKETVHNIELEAKNTNAIYYDVIEWQEEVYGMVTTKSKYTENEELASKVLKIDQLRAGETKEVDYQIAVKQVDVEDETLSGEISVKVDNEEKGTVQNITNEINKGKLKLNLEYMASENLNLYTTEQFQLGLFVKNISNSSIKNVDVELPVSDKLTFDSNQIDLGVNNDVRFVEYKNDVIKFNIPQIDAGEQKVIFIQLPVNSIPVSKTETQIRQYFTANSDSVTYISNDIEKTARQIETEMEVVQTTNINGNTVRDGENIQFTFDIENKGAISKDATFSDALQSGLNITGAKVIKNGTETDIQLNNGAVVSQYITIGPKEKMKIILYTTLDAQWVNGNKVSNMASVVAPAVSVESNVVEFTIEGKEPNNSNNSNNESGGNNGNGGNSDNSGNNGNNGSGTNESNGSGNGTSSVVNSIMGTAWIDENKNGNKDSTEAKLTNIPVYLLDGQTQKIAKNKNGSEISTVTDKDGNYQFTNLNNGKYTVAFIYDAKKYTVTGYQKEGISETTNSDVISNTININNSEIRCAITKELEINNNNLAYIDAGFIKADKFDLKLNKYVNTIIIENSAGREVKSFNKAQLAKTEIHAKQIEGSNVTIEYVIDVTNEGDVPGYASEIVDYLPSDLKFNQVQNSLWKQGQDGNLYSTALANQIIMPGETKSVSLFLTKKMTQDNVGTILNEAEISKEYNEYMLEDIDSKPANKNEKEDDMSGADIIISIKTGQMVMYISLIVTSVLMLAAGIYLIKKEVMID